jgi:hypothetical protein
MGLTFKNMNIQVVAGTSSATPGTRTTHAHSLGFAPSLARILVQIQAADNNTDDDTNGARAVAVVAVDATNITVKGDGVSTAFTAFVFLDKNAPIHSA